MIKTLLFALLIQQSYSWQVDTTKLANGPHNLMVIVTDDIGNKYISPVVNFNVDNAPPAPPPDTIVPAVSIASLTVSGGTGRVTATAVDNVGIVKSEIYYDGSLIATGLTATFKMTGKPGVLHTVTVKAYDAAGNVGTASGTIRR